MCGNVRRTSENLGKVFYLTGGSKKEKMWMPARVGVFIVKEVYGVRNNNKVVP